MSSVHRHLPQGHAGTSDDREPWKGRGFSDGLDERGEGQGEALEEFCLEKGKGEDFTCA